MKLYLVQHGEALAKDVDPERPLTEAGKADVKRLAKFLAKAGVRVERVLHSGKRRAAQTAKHLGRAIAPGLEPEVSGLLDPDANPAALDWQSGSWQLDTLIVGHLPFLAKLVSDLVTGEQSRPVVEFRPGSVACLERKDDGGWMILWMIRPELLGA